MSNLNMSATLELIDKISPTLSRIMIPLESTRRAFDQASEAVRNLERQQSQISSYQRLSSQLDSNNQSLNQARQRLQQLQQQFASTTNPTQALTNQLQQAERTFNRLTNTTERQRQRLTQLRNTLREAGVNVNNLADEQNRLRQSTDQARLSLAQQQRALERQVRIREQLERTTQNAQAVRDKATLVAGVGAMALALPIKEFAQAEESAMTLKVSMMDATGKVAPEFEKINALAERLGTSLPGSSAEFSTMMAKLVQQGISFQDILGGVGEASANLAVVMKMPFADAAEFAAKMQDATKTSAQDMTKLMDVIQKSYYLGVDSTNMLSGFAKISDGMKTIKMQGLEGAKAMAPLLVMADQASMQGESAGNAFSKIFKAMMNTDNITKALKNNKAGFQMNFTDGKGEFAGLDNMFKQLEQLKSLSTETRLQLLGDMFGNDSETIQALNILIDKGKTGYEETIAKMQTQADLQQRVNAQLSTLTNLWDSAKGTFTSIMATFGEALAPDIKSLVTSITEITGKIGEWAKQNPQLSTTLMRIAGIVVIIAGALAILSSILLAVIGPIALLRASIASLGTMTTGVSLLTKLGTALTWLGGVMRTVGLAMLSNPILVVIGVIAMGAFLIWQNWGTLGPKFTMLWNNITAGARTLWANMVAIWNSIKASIIATVQGLWTSITTLFSGGIARLIAIISTFNPVSLFMRAFSAVFAYFAGLGSQFATYGGNMIEGLKNGIMGRLGSVLAGIQSVASRIKSAFTSAMSIHSPSRIFMGYGDFIMQGLHKGLMANDSPISAMTATSNQLKQALDTSTIHFSKSSPITAQSLATGTAGQATAPININIYPTPNQSPSDIAQLVAHEIAKMGLGKQTNNTALYDHAQMW